MQGIQLRSVHKSYRESVALDGVDLRVDPGEFVSIVGPSGCGKSTLLRLVAGLEEHDGGEVWINGRQVDHLSPKNRDIAMVFQSYALYPHMTAFRNIATPELMRRLWQIERLPLLGLLSRRRARTNAEISRRVHDTARLLGIQDLLPRKPGQMSGGQRQRVALGRAIIREPSAFLMDEPLSNLDAALRVSMCAELLDLHKRLGVTCLYVTHDQAEAMRLSQRMAVMFDGKIFQIDKPEAIYHAPSHVRVAQFVGVPAINLLPAVVTVGETISALDLDLPIAADAAHATKVTLGVRPEAIRLTGGDGPGFSAVVTSVEVLGSETIIRARPQHPDVPIVIVRLPPYHPVRPRAGDVVSLLPEARHCVVFDETGRRIGAAPRDEARAVDA